jgi:hypothetical protein
MVCTSQETCYVTATKNPVHQGGGFSLVPLLLHPPLHVCFPHTQDFSLILLGSLLTTPLQLLPCLFLDQHARHFRGPGTHLPQVSILVSRLPSCLHPLLHAYDSHNFSPLLVYSLPSTPLHLFSCLFLDQQNCPFSGPS